MAFPSAHPIVFVDTKAWAIARLRDQLASRGIAAKVTGNKPSKIDGPTVWVEADGGQRDGVLESGFVRLNVFAGQRDEAYDLARAADALLTPDGVPIVACQRTTGPNEIDDEGSMYTRFNSVHAVTARGKDF